MPGRRCTTCLTSHAPPTGKNCRGRLPDTSDDQTTILAEIRAMRREVTALGSRLTTLESVDVDTTSSSVAEDTSSVAETEVSPASLKEDQGLARKVRKRMAELQLLAESDDDDDIEFNAQSKAKKPKNIRGKKSGRAKTAEDIVVKDIDWPHYHVYRGPKRTGANYHELNIQEFAYGYLCQLIDGGHTEATQTTMLSHMRDMMQDAMEYPWENVRNFHGILMAEMEMDRASWDDTDVIERLRTMYVHRASSASSKGQGSSHGNSPQVPFCLPYQEGKCQYDQNHSSSRGQVQHACAYCLKLTKNAYPHSEADCRRKRKNNAAKNGKQQA